MIGIERNNLIGLQSLFDCHEGQIRTANLDFARFKLTFRIFNKDEFLIAKTSHRPNRYRQHVLVLANVNLYLCGHAGLEFYFLGKLIDRNDNLVIVGSLTTSRRGQGRHTFHGAIERFVGERINLNQRLLLHFDFTN